MCKQQQVSMFVWPRPMPNHPSLSCLLTKSFLNYLSEQFCSSSHTWGLRQQVEWLLANSDLANGVISGMTGSVHPWWQQLDWDRPQGLCVSRWGERNAFFLNLVGVGVGCGNVSNLLANFKRDQVAWEDSGPGRSVRPGEGSWWYLGGWTSVECLSNECVSVCVLVNFRLD